MAIPGIGVLACGGLMAVAVLLGRPPRSRRLARARIRGAAGGDLLLRRRDVPVGSRDLPVGSRYTAVRRRDLPGRRLAALGRRGRRAESEGAAAPGQTAMLADQLAALVRAGLPPIRVWQSIAERSADPATRALAAEVVAGQRVGEATGTALHGALARAERQDAALAQLAVAVDVTERTGAGLAETLTQFAATLRAEEQAAAERAEALAGPRATAWVLSLLPLAGLGLGAAVGARPWHALLLTEPGRVCLVAGAGLWTAGRWWSARLVRRAATVS
jgi:tight adherence protein B